MAWDLPSVSHTTFHDLSRLRWASPARAPRAGSAPGLEETQLAAAAGVRPAPTSLGSHLWPVRQTRNPGPAAAQGASILDRTQGPPCPWLRGPRDRRCVSLLLLRGMGRRGASHLQHSHLLPKAGFLLPGGAGCCCSGYFEPSASPSPALPCSSSPPPGALSADPSGGGRAPSSCTKPGASGAVKGRRGGSRPVMAAWPTPERARGHPRQPPSPGLGLLPLARAAGCPHLPGAPASVSSASRPSASALLTAPRPGPPLPPESVSSVMKSGRQVDGHSRVAASGAVREGFRALVSAESRGGAGRGRGGRDGCRSFAVLGWTAPRRLGMSTSPVTSPGGV